MHLGGYVIVIWIILASLHAVSLWLLSADTPISYFQNVVVEPSKTSYKQYCVPQIVYNM